MHFLLTLPRCGVKTYFFIENGCSCEADFPRCLFLAGFDQLMLAYDKKESLYLKAENIRGIFNLAGIVMPAVMLDGQVIGRWKKKNKKVTVELFSGVGKKEKALMTEKAEELWGDLPAVDFAAVSR